MTWPSNKNSLLELGREHTKKFCDINKIVVPTITVVSASEWYFDVCAYYRPKCGIMICLEKCQVPCSVELSRNWTWPASIVDREPFGVIAHELGHHCDVLASDKKGTYYGNYSIGVCEAAAEKKLTNYCPNDHEWFAEMFRLFVTNPKLLESVRPKTFALLINRWTPIVETNWLEQLGDNVPPRVVTALKNKGAK